MARFGLIAFLCVCALQASLLVEAQTIVARDLRLPSPAAGEEQRYDYFTGLLRLALARGAEGRSSPRLVMGNRLEPDARSLESRVVDVSWLALDQGANKSLRVIYIPLDRGLFGYQRLVVRRDMLARLSQARELGALSGLTACVGDKMDVFTSAGLKIYRVLASENIYQALASRSCDYAPRDFNQLRQEQPDRQIRYPELVEVKGLLLYFPYAQFYAVRSEDEPLASWIERGLALMEFNGEIDQYMQSHAFTKDYFPLQPAAKIISLKNPTLPSSVDTHDARYWLQPIDFQPQQ